MEKQSNELIVKEINQIQVFQDWVDRKEAYMGAKEQFEIVDYQMKQELMKIFKKYGIKRFDNDDLQIVLRSAYTKQSWNNDALEQLFNELGELKENYQKETEVKETITIKYKGM